MSEAKIRLSSTELELIQNADWILTKNGLMHKTRRLLESVWDKQEDLLNTIGKSLPVEIRKIPAKISKGENYLGLPYLILDQPRYFDKENIFAIRTMFWWGNYFSTTLHLSGIYKDQFSEKIRSAYIEWKENDFYVCIHPDEWQHHFEKDNYKSMHEISEKVFSDLIETKKFLKIAKRLTLDKWDEAEIVLCDYFQKIVSILV